VFGIKSCRKKYETIDDRIIEIEVANPLRILSAYLITAAITNPPNALKIIQNELKVCEH